MKHWLIGICLILATTTTYSQKNKKNKKVDDAPVVNHDQAMEKLINQTGDVNMMLYHLYEKAAKDSTDMETLEQIAYIYLLQQKYGYCINVSQIILKNDPAHITALEILASAYQGSNQKEKAIITYQKLLGYQEHPKTHYQLATLYFETGNDVGCQEYLNKVLNDTTSKNHSVIINFQDANQQLKKQEVNLIAACYNIVGFLYLKNEQVEEAKRYFNAAVQIAPNFVLPKGNLQMIQNAEQKAAEEAAKKDND